MPVTVGLRLTRSAKKRSFACSRTCSMPKLLLILIALFCACTGGKAQDTAARGILSFPDKLFGALDRKAARVEEKLARQTEKYLSKLERQESRLKRTCSLTTCR